jgi:hypothetical protein
VERTSQTLWEHRRSKQASLLFTDVDACAGDDRALRRLFALPSGTGYARCAVGTTSIRPMRSLQ